MDLERGGTVFWLCVASKSDGDMNVLGPRRSPGLGYVDGDINLVGPGRPYRLGTNDGESNLLGLQRSSQFGSFADHNVNSQATTPFQGDVMPGQWTNQFGWKYKTNRSRR